ncbi:NAD binding domain of 6-phosphogluconate dehydrogenase-domain-containing protein [Lipomyces japonicus]|uniref:NAD binding domain of 6-phosphogluconate dehydrogenase-domain-containing protein n=1 Tax=Lipomyces japonicus TaxID=56871 RepID=UPI0034CE88DB
MVNTLPEIGFIGLGAMGGGMARNLASLGFPVTGYDLYQPLVEKLVAAGGSPALSPAEAARSAEFLILMVVNDVQADAVLFDGGAVAALRQNGTIILCSTTPPKYLADLRQHLDSVRPDIKLLDCPVSGGSIRAAAGTLSIFSSGPVADLEKADVILKAMSDPLYRIPGGIGMGSVAKMCHQHQAATNIITASEAMGLAAVAGLNTNDVYEAVIKSIGRSWMFENRGPHMLKNDYLTVHSAVSIILKDNTIVTNHAKREGFPLVLENTAEQLYITGTHAGLTKEDDAGLVRLFIPKQQPDLIGNLTLSDVKVGKAGITIDTIIDLFSGVHLASTRECIAFAQHVGLDLRLLEDIVNKGAGASNIFETTVAQFLSTGDVSLKSVKETSQILKNLEAAVRKASELRQPVPMASAALNQIYYDIAA